MSIIKYNESIKHCEKLSNIQLDNNICQLDTLLNKLRNGNFSYKKEENLNAQEFIDIENGQQKKYLI